MTTKNITSPADMIFDIPKMLNTFVSKYPSLNANQAKKMDVIYAEDDVKMCLAPKEPANLIVEKIKPYPAMDVKKITQRECTPNIFVDSLYVPKIPGHSTGYVFLLTKDAQQAVKEEMSTCMGAVKNKDNIGIMKGLADIGVLDAINTHAHEKFLGKDKDNYRSAIATLQEVKTILITKAYESYYNTYLKNPNFTADDINFPQGNNKIGFGDYIEKLRNKFIELKKIIKKRNKHYVGRADDLKVGYLKTEKSDKEARIFRLEQWHDAIIGVKRNEIICHNETLSRTRKIVKDAREELEKIVRKYEAKAARNARKVEFTDSEGKKRTYRFYVHEGRQYYTSNKEVQVYQNLQKLSKVRKDYNLPDEIDVNNINSSTKVPDLLESHKFYKKWKKAVSMGWIGIHDFLERSTHGNNQPPKEERKLIEWTRTIFNLNLSGAIIKEQVMTEQELYQGKEKVNEINFDDNDTIEDIINKVNFLEGGDNQSAVSAASRLGYYSAYTLYLKLVLISNERLSDFVNITGVKNSPYQKRLKKLFGVTHAALSRCIEIEDQAKDKCAKAKTLSDIALPNLFEKNLDAYNYDEFDPYPHIIWNEHDWTPKDRTDQIYNDAGTNKVSLVECSLASEYKDKAKRGYIRSNLGVIADPNSKTTVSNNLLQTLAIEVPKITVGDAENAKFTRKVTAKKIKKQISNIEGIKDYTVDDKADESKQSILSKLKSTIKFSTTGDEGAAIPIDQVDEIKYLPWFVTENEIFGLKGRWETSGQAQFFRFLGDANGSIINGPKQLGENVTIHGKAVAAQGAWSFNFDYPITKQGNTLEIPYVYKEGEQNKLGKYNAGQYIIHVDGAVQGFLGASITLSESVEMGYNKAGEFGVRGEFENTAGATESSNEPLLPTSDAYKKGATVGVTGAANAFAGMQCGGSVNCEFLWCPPEDKTPSHLTTGLVKTKPSFHRLARVSSSVSLSAGIGIQGTCQMAFKNGCFIIVLSASATFGTGAGGTIGLAINPTQADNFFKTILNLMYQANYRYIRFYSDDENDPDGTNTYVAFNKVLSLMLMTGLGVGEILCMPFNLIESMHTELLSDDNSYFIANAINDTDLKSENISFYEKLPPETLAPILTSLIHFHETSFFGGDSASQVEDKNSAQFHALHQLIEWVDVQGNLTKKRRLIETIQRMGLKHDEILDKSEQWDRFGRYLICILSFSYNFLITTESPHV